MASKRILSEPQLDEMAELYERGWSAQRIAAHFTAAGTPIGPSAIYWQCMRVGADRPAKFRGQHTQATGTYLRNGHPVRPYSPEEDECLRQLDEAGVSLREMARRLDRRDNSIRGRLMTLARMDARREDIEASSMREAA